jgi:hypothetical protein
MARNTTLLPMYLESKGDTRRGPRDELLQSLMQQQAHAGVGTPVYSIPQGIARTGNMMMLSLMNKWEKDEEKAKHKKAGDTLFSSLGAMLGGGAPKAADDAVKLAKVLNGESFADKVVNVESGGDPYAKNPRSTATGPGQFIESTWIDQINKIKPELAAGKTREEVLQLRTDPGLSREMTEAYGNENARILSERGVPVNEATKYLAHFAGPGGAVAIMTSAPETPAAQLLGRHVVEANPFLENMTAKDIQGWATRKMGGAGEARVEPAAPPPQAMPQQQVASLDPNFLPREAQTRPAPQNAPPAPQAAQLAPGQPQQPYAPQQAPQGQQEASQPLGGFMQPEEMQMLRTLYDSGEMSGADIAQYVQSKRNQYLESQKPDYAYEKMDDGTLIQVDKRTGQVSPVYQGGQKPTDDIREFEYGQQNPDFIEQQIKLKQAGRNQINVGGEGPADSMLRKELSKEEGTQWINILKQGQKSATMTQELQILDELLQQAPQGPIQGRLAEMFPGFSAAGDAANAIVLRIAPQMKVEGSGSTSDIEYAGMVASMPRLSAHPQGNRLIAETMKAKGAIDIERAKIVNAYQNEQIPAAQAREMLAELNQRSIMTPELRALLQPQDGQGAQPSAGGIKPGTTAINPQTGERIRMGEDGNWEAFQ